MADRSERKRTVRIISTVLGIVALAGILLVLLSVPFVKTEGTISDTMIIKNINLAGMDDEVSKVLDGQGSSAPAISIDELGEINGTYYVEFYHFGKSYKVESNESMMYGISKKYSKPGAKVDIWINPFFPDKIFKIDFK